MPEQNYTDSNKVWSRITEHDKQIAAMVTDIRGIYSNIDEIRNVLVRIQDGAKPNLGGMFLVLIATCTFLVTIGGLTMAPVYRDLTRMYEVQDKTLTDLNTIQGNRFTARDAENLEDKLREQARETHAEISKVLQEHETYTAETRERLSKVEGYIDGFLEGRSR